MVMLIPTNISVVEGRGGCPGASWLCPMVALRPGGGGLQQGEGEGGGREAWSWRTRRRSAGADGQAPPVSMQLHVQHVTEPAVCNNAILML